MPVDWAMGKGPLMVDEIRRDSGAARIRSLTRLLFPLLFLLLRVLDLASLDEPSVHFLVWTKLCFR